MLGTVAARATIAVKASQRRERCGYAIRGAVRRAGSAPAFLQLPHGYAAAHGSGSALGACATTGPRPTLLGAAQRSDSVING